VLRVRGESTTVSRVSEVSMVPYGWSQGRIRVRATVMVSTDLQTDLPEAGQTHIRVQNPRDPLVDSKTTRSRV